MTLLILVAYPILNGLLKKLLLFSQEDFKRDFNYELMSLAYGAVIFRILVLNATESFEIVLIFLVKCCIKSYDFILYDKI